MKNLTNPIPKLTLGAALLGLAVAPSPPARAVDLLERYPSYLTKGLLGAANARAWSVTADDLFQVSRFRLVVGDQLKIETGPATLGIGHCSVGATVAILIPAEGGKLTRQGSAAPEEIAHIWLRFHPKEINRLFPPSTVSAGASDLLGQMRRIVAGKFMSSYHAGNQVMIPEPKDMTVDLDTQAGPRRFFMVDTEAKTAQYVDAFAGQPVRVTMTSGASQAGRAPKVVSTSPADGATDVDPGLKEIRVTFDQDMDNGGMSWTGGPPMFPPSPPGARAHWQGARACVLPVKLESGRQYRVGINAPSYHNFRSAGGVAAQLSSITFTTK